MRTKHRHTALHVLDLHEAECALMLNNTLIQFVRNPTKRHERDADEHHDHGAKRTIPRVVEVSSRGNQRGMSTLRIGCPSGPTTLASDVSATRRLRIRLTRRSCSNVMTASRAMLSAISRGTSSGTRMMKRPFEVLPSTMRCTIGSSGDGVGGDCDTEHLLAHSFLYVVVVITQQKTERMYMK